MSDYNLDSLFRPTSIAIAGEDKLEDSLGYRIFENITHGGYSGAVYPVRLKHKGFLSKKEMLSFREIQSKVDLVILAAPLPVVPDLLQEFTASAPKGVFILSEKGTDTTWKETEIEAVIRKKAYQMGVRVIGPSCFGMICTHSQLNASLYTHMPCAGKTAFISQSAAICASILDLSVRDQIGFSHFICVGSMLDVDIGDLIDHFGYDTSVSNIVIQMERIPHIRKFMSAARAVSRIKPIIVLRSGRSGAMAAGEGMVQNPLTDEDAIYDTAFIRSGIVRVKTFEELFDCSELLSKQPRPNGKRLAVVTNGWGPGMMAMDMLQDYHAEPATLSNDTKEKLNRILPAHWSHGNFIDISQYATSELYRKTVDVCINAPEIEGLLIIYAAQSKSSPEDIARTLVTILQKRPYPVFTSWMGGDSVKKGRDVFNHAGIPTFDTPERAVRAFVDLYRYSANLKVLQEIPPRLPKEPNFNRSNAGRILYNALDKNRSFLDNADGKSLLTAYGIPAEPLHASTPADYTYELMMGFRKNSEFGPVLFFGEGGLFAEIIADQALDLPPLNRHLASRLMGSTKIGKILKGYRQFPPADLLRLEEILIRLSQLAIDFPEIETLDINPLVVAGNNIYAEDVAVQLKKSDIQATHHLVISPYPNQYEAHAQVKDSTKIFIRPIRPEDAPLLTDFFDALSSRSRYLRFFSQIRHMPHSMLIRFTQIDYDREVALIALSEDRGEEKMLGVARVITEINRDRAEFSVVTADAWQGKGIGAELLKRCLDIAAKKGIKTVWGVVLPENKQMMLLGEKLGMKRKRVIDTNEYELELTFQNKEKEAA